MKYLNIGGKIQGSEISLGMMRISGMTLAGIDSLVKTSLEAGINFLTMRIFTAGENAKKCFQRRQA